MFASPKSSKPPVTRYAAVAVHTLRSVPTLFELSKLLSPDTLQRASGSTEVLSFNAKTDAWSTQGSTSSPGSDPNDGSTWSPPVSIRCTSPLTSSAFPYRPPPPSSSFLRRRRRSRQQPSASLLSEIAETPATFAVMAFNALLYFLAPATTTSFAAVAPPSLETERLLLSAFSHGSLLHLCFNSFTTYSLRPLEVLHGSVAYLSLSLLLAPLTGLLHLLLSYSAACLSARSLLSAQRAAASPFGQQRSLGYSAVLFALLTLATLRADSYAPLPFLPGFEFRTYALPLGLRASGAPLLLLVATQAALERASFLGHLAGILAGYAASWLSLARFCDPAVFAPALLLMEGAAHRCGSSPDRGSAALLLCSLLLSLPSSSPPALLSSSLLSLHALLPLPRSSLCASAALLALLELAALAHELAARALLPGLTVQHAAAAHLLRSALLLSAAARAAAGAPAAERGAAAAGKVGGALLFWRRGGARAEAELWGGVGRTAGGAVAV
ncbi:hypothetical protein TeGR_g3643 [Tetraparma gracilis]|uniref:Peptidase S54 rhomboid domain-containing protein n=1 Tax=Tetraparma gracilis TaxID=2962635 RepID=A0ABQ6MYU4_9STRA|nr:hypothetical protein TeGR_g3643 [Tetraparma gracilis]